MTTDDASGEVGHRLAAERSPFLRHGASQPVDWWPWGEGAFAAARELDRPVLLDIGAVWCHWCHVMDHESYDDRETAALINELFVPVKVDRDERPDVDARYQKAVQLLTGQGGWPLTAFLTPDGDVFHGGTYFPPVDAHGRPSFQRVLREVARVWREDRDRAQEAVRGIRGRLAAFAQAETQPGEPRAGLIEAAIDELASSFDFRYGGFGRAPKFPSPAGLDLMLDYAIDNGTEWARRIVTETLGAMARGGIHDQLGGGFHRYSTDARWIIPHFEKMAYDNGPLLATYAAAASALGDPLFRDVSAGIIAHYEDVAADLVAAGGFPASQDADFGIDDDGDYWTWTLDEMREAIGDETDFRAARLRFGLDDAAGAMHLDSSRHVLFRALDDASLAGELRMPAEAARAAVGRAAERLKAARDRRPAPFVDRTIYTGWTALVASGHLAAARYLGWRRAAESGLRALERVWRETFVAEHGVRHRAGDEVSGFVLEDQAFVLLAQLDAFELTQDERWLERAALLAGALESRFRDGRSGAFRDRPQQRETVAMLEGIQLPVTDAPTPSGNGAAALGLLRLAELTGDEARRESGRAVLRAFAGSAARLLGSAATYMKALAWDVWPVTSVVVVDDAAPGKSALLDAALRSYRPRTVVRHLDPRKAEDATVPDEMRALMTGEAPRAYVCAKRTCAAPASQPAELAERLRTFRP